MPRNRFEKLRSCLHINDNSLMKLRYHPNYDKLFKVRPYIDALKKIFAKTEPEEFSSVDEIMIPFKGHSSLKPYIKNKPHKWGIKLFVRAGVSGIIYEFDVYVGKYTVMPIDNKELGMSGNVVVQLTEYLPKHKKFKICTDNFFTSLQLVQHLKSVGILCIGTVRSNRLKGLKLLDDKELKRDERGAYDFATEVSSNIVAVKWFDNKSVTVLCIFRSRASNFSEKMVSERKKLY
ncbi:unnamed protein product [Acanthoscelides obtectus]|uniref:PiggyBac transposable element-derived protein domain-containing protein n=1 Tax=Acanthoscelides obtectus TaxID=200917 RepID=A0A9P0PVK6_ACAOB|nr:unnamed protein product [Acanthoscelides obtectus]CAK1649430.1 PiggyBac transposable element-derived protein 3 [Acanthoscelides obtectus]